MSVQEAVHKLAPEAETSYDWDLRNSTGPLAKMGGEAKQGAGATLPAGASAATPAASGANNKKRD